MIDIAITKLSTIRTSIITTIDSYDIGQIDSNIGAIDLVDDDIENTFKNFLKLKIGELYTTVDALLHNLKSADFSSIISQGIQITNAFLCGILNSLIDAIVGYLWLLKALFDVYSKVIDSVRDFKNTYLQFMEYSDSLRQALRNIDFGKIWAVIQSNFKALGVKLLHLSPYELAYCAGALVGAIIVLAIEIVIGIIISGGVLSVAAVAKELALIFRNIAKGTIDISKRIAATIGKASRLTTKALTNAYRSLLRFLQQGTDNILKIIDDFFAALKKKGDDVAEGVKKIAGLSKEELDWMASRKIGSLGGNILKSSQIRKLRGIVQKHGIQLIVEGDAKSITNLFKKVDGFRSADELFAFMQNKKPPLVGGFNAETKQFYLTKNCTELVAFHEQAHLKQYLELGEDVYKTLDKLQKETYVWEQILANKGKWTKAEIEDALWYVNDIRTNPKYGYNLEPLKVKI